MGKDIHTMDSEKYDWYKCKECNEVEFAEKKNFISIVMKRDKLCLGCIYARDKERTNILNTKKREERKAMREAKARLATA